PPEWQEGRLQSATQSTSTPGSGTFLWGEAADPAVRDEYDRPTESCKMDRYPTPAFVAWFRLLRLLVRHGQYHAAHGACQQNLSAVNLRLQFQPVKLCRVCIQVNDDRFIARVEGHGGDAGPVVGLEIGAGLEAVVVRQRCQPRDQDLVRGIGLNE